MVQTRHGSHIFSPTCQEKHFQTATCHIQSFPGSTQGAPSFPLARPAFNVADMTPSEACKLVDTKPVDFAKSTWCLSPNLKVVSASKGSVSSTIPSQISIHNTTAYAEYIIIHCIATCTRPVTGKRPMWQLEVLK